MYRWLVLILITCINFGLESSAQLYPFVNYSPKDGLVGTKVRSIGQDSKGKIYVSTADGLSVYDGARFTNYTVENGLYASMVNGIKEVGDDSILVILNSRKLQYLRNGKIGDVSLKDSFCPVINQLITTSNGKEYAIADEGLYRLDRDHFTRIELTGLPASNDGKNFHRAIEIDSLLFINTDVNPAYRASKLFLVYNVYTGVNLVDTTLPDIYFSIKTPQNELLLATGNGLFYLDKIAIKKGEFRLLPPSKPYSIPKNTYAHKLYFDRQQNLWMGTWNSVMKIPPGEPPIIFTEQNGLPQDGASFFFQDREGIMWFGSDINGLSKLVDQGFQFYKVYKPGLTISDIYSVPDRDTFLLFDRVNGRLLLLHNNTTSEYQATKHLPFYWVVMRNEKVYAGNGTTLFKLQLLPNGKFTFSPLYTSPDKTESIGTLIMDKHENLIAAGTSLTVLHSGNKVTRQPLDYFADWALLTEEGLLYVVTRSMNIYVYRIDASNPDHYLQLVTRYIQSDQNIEPRSYVMDNLGRLWLGTRRRGVYCYNIINGKLNLIRQLSVKDGLTDNFVKFLYSDSAGHIWAGTPTGLDKITVSDKGVIIENIPKAANMYLDIHRIQGDKKGVIWAVATYGLVKVFPSKADPPVISPEIIFTKVTAANHDLPVQQAGTKLKHFQNSLYFQVAVPSFFDEKKILYSYKLEESGSNSEEWTSPSTQADIRFMNLPPGNYELKVRSIFSNGKYPPLEAGYSFRILTPWWQSWWFQWIILLASLTLILFFFRMYYRNKLHRELSSLEKKEAIEKERTRIAIDMHDDMGAGLSRIKVLSETIKFENQKGIVNPTHLQKISAYSDEMMDKMGEIVWALNQRNDSLNDLLSYIRVYTVDFLSNHGKTFSFDEIEEYPEIFITGEVRRNIFLSVKEALHNVVKHADATNVDIKVSTGKELSILIQDNGKGIDLDNMREFGNGVNNIRKRMTEIGGAAAFRNENGTWVLLKMPLDV